MSHLGDDCHAAAMFVSLLCFPARMFDFLRRVMRLRRILRAFAFGVFFVLVCAFVFYLHYTADAGFELGFKNTLYIYLCIYIYMHTPTYLPTYIHTYIRTFVCTCIHTYMPRNILH